MSDATYNFNSVTCSFIGLGLIGGSIAKALRRAYPDIRLTAYDPDASCIKQALDKNVITQCETGLTDALFSCDYLFLCAPVSNNDSMLAAIKEHIKPGTVITDVGSVKQTTHRAIADAGLSHAFIGGHPMAGSEKTGFANSNPLLLENAYYILTPTQDVDPQKVDELKEMIKGIGALPLILDYDKHDYITAAVSHLPHIISACLVNLVEKSDDADGLMKMIAAGGFKDITRISSSSPVMWQSVCLTNTENIRKLLSDYISDLQKVEKELADRSEQQLYDLFDSAKDYRDGFASGGHGPIKKSYEIYVDIPDIPGSLAQTATILALHGLSIKNIGIMHSREFQEGALRIEFYDEATEKTAVDVLKKSHYTIYEK
ncbi:MAG: prephenate dehydrogenase [Lachnospiraceae bacterium]|nr:prephenate dehydrogenase [Lachnospiraceae bacterium]